MESAEIFVYGTLRKGGSNHYLIEEGGGRFVRIARTRPEFELLDLGPYPGMVAGGSTSVLGEVYVVDARLRERLDRLEDHPRWYRRTSITLADGSDVETYLLQSHPSTARSIESGDWMT